MIIIATSAMGGFFAGLFLVHWLHCKQRRILQDALAQVRLRVVYARFLIFRDWRAANDLLGIAERGVAKALRQQRPDLLTSETPIETRVMATGHVTYMTALRDLEPGDLVMRGRDVA